MAPEVQGQARGSLVLPRCPAEAGRELTSEALAASMLPLGQRNKELASGRCPQWAAEAPAWSLVLRASAPGPKHTPTLHGAAGKEWLVWEGPRALQPPKKSVRNRTAETQEACVGLRAHRARNEASGNWPLGWM